MTDDVLIQDWYMVRHAPVIGGAGGIYKSRDASADLSNHAAFAWLATMLPERGEAFTSPLSRARATAAATLAAMREAPAATDDRLREQDFGNWFGLSFDTLWQKIEPLPPHNWSLLAADTQPPGGEAFTEVMTRMRGFMEARVATGSCKPQIVFAHAGVIRAAVGAALDMDAQRALGFAVAPLSLTPLQYCDRPHLGGHWRLVSLNKTAPATESHRDMKS
jgi:alpha-ribazole phosphatase